jgi:hypothetical protein
MGDDSAFAADSAPVASGFNIQSTSPDAGQQSFSMRGFYRQSGTVEAYFRQKGFSLL